MWRPTRNAHAKYLIKSHSAEWFAAVLLTSITLAGRASAQETSEQTKELRPAGAAREASRNDSRQTQPQSIETGRNSAQPLAPTERDRRLQEIERQLLELTKAIEELRRGAATTAATGRAASAEPSKVMLGTNWLKTLTWRSIGPANMGGRIVDLAVVESDPTTYWVATASGGLLKTTNNGVSFIHQFDREATVSLGAVCVAPSDPNIVWVGTGENNPRNSVSYGDGVYKSTDGGKTWQNMGLKKSYQIGRLLIHPKNPNIVYAGLFGEDAENGARLTRVVDNGPSAKAGLQVDDIIQSVDGKLIVRYDQLTDEIREHKIGDKVKLNVRRGEASQQIEVTLAERPQTGGGRSQTRPSGGLLGGQFENVQDEQGTNNFQYGGVYKSTDGGKSWTNIAKNVGLPGPRWVASIEPSRFVEGRALAAFDGHRSDDDEPYVYLTEDFGKTWKSLRANLPWGSTRVLREDLRNPNLLYLGTEFGAWFSLDRGTLWKMLGANLPTVAVHEFAIHPGNSDLVAATHGRSLWVLDVSALRQIKPEYLADQPALYQPDTVIRWRNEPARGRTNRRFVGQNPNRGAQVYYSLPKKAEKASVRIVDITGTTLREFPAKNNPGLHLLTWDLRATPARQTNTVARPQGSGEEAETAQRSGQGGRGGGGQQFGGAEWKRNARANSSTLILKSATNPVFSDCTNHSQRFHD